MECSLAVHKMMMENNEPKMMEIKEADPGDTLIYTLNVTNNEPGAVTNLNPTLPIPDYTTLVPTLISPAENYTVSADNKDFKPYPILDAQGQPIPDSDYRAVKWNLGNLNNGDAKTFKIGVKVN
ncbi:hypothetical protein [Cetobacterium sp. SF1]|uniref:hypothetical protein n=1 Tax=Cetobacterium sp. SF1 TaxID=3417654 RepID=UPI003CF9AA25